MKKTFFNLGKTGRIFWILSAAAFFGCAGFSGGIGAYEPGLYEGRGEGYRGPITVLARVGVGGIRAVEILEHQEDALVGAAAMEELLEAVLDSNSTDLDAVSGATESSAGFLSAVEDALSKARAGKRAEK
jgi:uncharacterized protein with FMN-binding domain